MLSDQGPKGSADLKVEQKLSVYTVYPLHRWSAFNERPSLFYAVFSFCASLG